MPLDSVVEKLNSRRRAAPSPRAFVESAQPPKFAASDNPYLRKIVELVDRQGLSPTDVREGFVALAAGIVEVDGQVQALSEKLDSMIKVISEIEIPVPPAHDMSAIEQALAEIQKVLDEFEPAMEDTAEPKEEEPKAKKRWKFDVKRGPGGAIRTIEAVED